MQLQKNINLQELKIVYFKFHAQCWRQIGISLGKNKNLQSLKLIACGLD